MNGVEYEDFESFIKDLEARLEKSMPEIRRQIKVYEDNLKNGTLKPLSDNNPLFNND